MQNIIGLLILATLTLANCETPYSVHGDIKSFIKKQSYISSYLSKKHDDEGKLPKVTNLKTIARNFRIKRSESTVKNIENFFPSTEEPAKPPPTVENCIVVTSEYVTGYDYWGNDLGMVFAGNEKECYNACVENLYCYVWLWRSDNQNCWLKWRADDLRECDVCSAMDLDIDYNKAIIKRHV